MPDREGEEEVCVHSHLDIHVVAFWVQSAEPRDIQLLVGFQGGRRAAAQHLRAKGFDAAKLVERIAYQR